MHEKIKGWLAEVAEQDHYGSFEQLYLHFLPGMRAYAAALVGDKDVALDLVQDLFASIWANRKNLAGIGHPANYLYRALKNNAVHYLKSRKRIAPLSSEEGEYITLAHEGPETGIIAKEARQLLETAINGLPYKCRLVFRLIKEEGLRYKDVASLLEISVKTVEAHMRLAYGRIVECLELMDKPLGFSKTS
ncbi:sigma-70 family RNA polymerase sigma factor [Niabella drilacis]|uniref:RNA polymerase sigma-70 factor, ECF subfamily n=1 Tax=Niabella drilacis (strain DSM 25811 / CCM 8410 / CCUG 62505 / LMG 26954 / E90) TaxID=1285928 RepID=A0A1G6I9A1_NIADE|nr:sigma-70 family RNA polymerase sigma factor [Niabella drilacis]SDC03031.1 RNA polymerase sigma-70 factor, ECF subfamily [Niabella drilacis]